MKTPEQDLAKSLEKVVVSYYNYKLLDRIKKALAIKRRAIETIKEYNKIINQSNQIIKEGNKMLNNNKIKNGDRY